MRLLSSLLLAAVAALADCRPAPVPAATPVRGGEPGIPTATWPAIYFRTFDRVTQAAELPPLRLASAAGGREVRIWIGGGIGYPQTLYRFIDVAGELTGEQVLYWPARPPDATLGERPGESYHDLIVDYQRGRCHRFRVEAQMGICRTRFTRTPDWKGVLRRAEAADLWSLPDESTLPRRRLVLDGWGITVELRDGPLYRAYHYGNPDRQEWPEARQAVAIAHALRSVDSLAHRADVERWYRGVTTGRYKSAFRPCDQEATWRFDGELQQLRGGQAFAAVVDTTEQGREYIVEVLGILTPAWVARRWNSPFPRVLQPLEVRAVAPWSGSACGQSSVGG